jgi:hypothetical protein
MATAPALDGLDWVMIRTERGSGFAVAAIAPLVIKARTINSKRTAAPFHRQGTTRFDDQKPAQRNFETNGSLSPPLADFLAFSRK